MVERTGLDDEELVCSEGKYFSGSTQFQASRFPLTTNYEEAKSTGNTLLGLASYQQSKSASDNSAQQNL